MVTLGGAFFGTPAAARPVPTLAQKKIYFFLQKGLT
jgi:hypothetical protein